MNTGGSGDGHCRQWSSPASVRLTLGLGMVGKHSCFIPWEHPSTAPLQNEPALPPGFKLGLNVSVLSQSSFLEGGSGASTTLDGH